MNYQPSNGHSSALTEPNSISSIALPVIKKAKKNLSEREEKNDGFMDEYLASNDLEDYNSSVMADDETMTAPGENIPVQATAFPVIPVISKNKVFGRYKGQLGNFELELRVDIDGNMPLQKISGDYYLITGQTRSYFGSFVAGSISTSILNNVITITGTASTTWATSFNKLKIVIKQTLILQPLAPALLQWFHITTNAPGATYVCNNFSRAFRTVLLEQDRTAGLIPFVSYNTGALPSGGPARALSINSAYTEAGVEMLNAGIANVVPITLAGPDAKWTDAELHNAMVNHFSLYQNNAAWNVWLLHAYEYVTAVVLGIMFDQAGLQRQGCAVFYKGLGGASAEQQRLQLYACVHELGHCFNLLHSWQKSLATPPKPNIPSSLSWMNYPWYYPSGPVAFWSHFPFQFDPVELTHIRHGFRNNVIMGGNPFGVGASLQEDTGGLFEDNIENTANLELELEAKQTYMLGEPVVLETKLKTTSTKNKRVISSLHANYGFVTIGIKKPSGEITVYEPVAEKCIVPEFTVLNSTNPGVYESSYIGFGKQGFIFDQVGNYQIRAVFYHEDGSRIVSDTLKLRVKYPVGQQDNEIADLLLNEEVGYLFAFMGSDAPYLKKGNDALNLIADKYKEHPLAVYAQFVKGVNEQRTFKTITADKNLEVRPPNFAYGETMLHEVVEKSKAGKGLDNISLNQTMQILAKAYQREGNMKAAEDTVKNLVNHFNKQPIKKEVKEMIAKKAATILSPEKDNNQNDEMNKNQ